MSKITESKESDLSDGEPTIQSKPVLVTRLPVSEKQELSSLNLGGEILASNNLINDSAKHLFALMKDLKSSETSCMTACELAKRIEGLAKVKIESIKLMKELIKN